MFKFLSLSTLIIFTFFSWETIGAVGCPDAATSSPWVFLQRCASDAVGAVSVWYSNDDGKTEIKELIRVISERIIQFGALFAIGVIVFSGIRYTTSAWDDEKIKSAKNTMLYSIIGLIILLVAFPMVDVILNFVYSLGT